MAPQNGDIVTAKLKKKVYFRFRIRYKRGDSKRSGDVQTEWI